VTVQTGLVTHAINVLLIVGIVAGAGVSAWTRRRREARPLAILGLPASLVFLLFCISDWALLQALPRLRLSFAPEIGLPLLAGVLVRLAMFWGLLGAVLVARWQGPPRSKRAQTRSAAILFLAVNLGFSFVQLDAYVLEPLLVETTELSLAFDDLDAAAPPVRLVHLTDTHIERSSFRETIAIRRVNALRPDIIVLTGDYLNLSYLSDPDSAAHFRRFVGQLEAPYGVYAVRGSVEPTPESMARLVEGTGVVWLEQEVVTVDVRGQLVTLAGVACSHRAKLDAARLDQTMDGIPADAFTVLLYHSPDLILEAAEHQVDLYLGGHTHGGQLRLPFYGAIITASRFGKQYASGLSEEDGTQMYISRGLGFEGGWMPRARFLCRPEIVSIELTGRGR
jgi:predicted MPP superfamily phosphohydrolase